MLEYYLKVSPSVNEPPYTRPAWFTLSEAEWVRWCERRTSSLSSGEAVYSISGWAFLSTNLLLQKEILRVCPR